MEAELTRPSTPGHLYRALGVQNIPKTLFSLRLPEATPPTAEQIDMIRRYLANERYLDAGEPGTMKTFPAHCHGILMAALGNQVVYTMPPKLIEQFYDEMLDWFAGVENHLAIERYVGSAAQKKALLHRWQAEGWPSILMVSYDGYRELNDVSKKKKIGKNQWYNEAGQRVADNYAGAKFTKDGRPLTAKGYVSNNKHLLLTRAGYNVFFFDEAHYLSGMDSIISRSVLDTVGRDTALYLMTGTPTRGDIGSAYGLIRLVNPDAYSGQASFERQHAVKRPMRVSIKGKPRTIRVVDHWVNTEKIHRELFRYARRLQKRQVMKLPDP